MGHVAYSRGGGRGSSRRRGEQRRPTGGVTAVTARLSATHSRLAAGRACGLVAWLLVAGWIGSGGDAGEGRKLKVEEG